MDYEIQRCSRKCEATGRELAEGEIFFSVLMPQGRETIRHDYSQAAWTGPPEGALAWWKSQMPTRDARRARLAPDEVLLEYFHGLADQPEQAELRYVLALLLVRRRILRMTDDDSPAEGELLKLYSPREAQDCTVVVATPDASRAGQIQDELGRLLYAEAN